MLALSVAHAATAAIDLQLESVQAVYEVGDIVEIRLLAVSDSSAVQFSAGLLAAFTWETGSISLLGLDQQGATPVLAAGFPSIYAANEASPPSDGDGVLQVLAPLGDPIPASPAGTLVTTFRFLATAMSPSVEIALIPQLGSVDSIVFDGTVPNLDVTGQLGSTFVTIVPGPAAALPLLFWLHGAGRRRRGRPPSTR